MINCSYYVMTLRKDIANVSAVGFIFFGGGLQFGSYFLYQRGLSHNQMREGIRILTISHISICLNRCAEEFTIYIMQYKNNLPFNNFIHRLKLTRILFFMEKHCFEGFTCW